MHKSLLTAFSNSSSDNLKSKIKNRKLAGIVVVAVAFALCGAVTVAQQPKKVPRLGYLTSLDAATESTRTEPFRLACTRLAT